MLGLMKTGGNEDFYFSGLSVFCCRLDLLHAIIVGPRGTPFDSTPFFFEIKLPEEYPNKPPRVCRSCFIWFYNGLCTSA